MPRTRQSWRCVFCGFASESSGKVIVEPGQPQFTSNAEAISADLGEGSREYAMEPLPSLLVNRSPERHDRSLALAHCVCFSTFLQACWKGGQGVPDS